MGSWCQLGGWQHLDTPFLLHPNLYFANNAEIFAAREDEGEHQVAVPEFINASIADKTQLSKQKSKFKSHGLLPRLTLTDDWLVMR